MTITEEAAGTRLRGEPSSCATAAEVGILLYRGCQSAMVHGLTDMLATASDFSVARGGRALLLSHWSPDEVGTFCRSFDSRPGAEGLADILVAPGRLSGPVTAEEAVPVARWLTTQHARGAGLELWGCVPAGGDRASSRSVGDHTLDVRGPVSRPERRGLCCKDDRRRWEDGDKLDPISFMRWYRKER
jgi:hypothetical protein